jgi:hypothetical protein
VPWAARLRRAFTACEQTPCTTPALHDCRVTRARVCLLLPADWVRALLVSFAALPYLFFLPLRCGWHTITRCTQCMPVRHTPRAQHA